MHANGGSDTTSMTEPYMYKAYKYLYKYTQHFSYTSLFFHQLTCITQQKHHKGLIFWNLYRVLLKEAILKYMGGGEAMDF